MRTRPPLPMSLVRPMTQSLSTHMGFSHPILFSNSLLFSVTPSLRLPLVTETLGFWVGNCFFDSPTLMLSISSPPPTQTFKSVTFICRLPSAASRPSTSSSSSSSLRTSSTFPPTTMPAMSFTIIPNHIILKVCSESNIPRNMYFTS